MDCRVHLTINAFKVVALISTPPSLSQNAASVLSFSTLSVPNPER